MIFQAMPLSCMTVYMYGLLTKREVKMAGYWPSSFFSKHDKLYFPDKARIPSGQDSPILPVRVANHSARFGSSCPLTELDI